MDRSWADGLAAAVAGLDWRNLEDLRQWVAAGEAEGNYESS